MDPKLKGVKKKIQEREYTLKINIRAPFSQSTYIQIGTKGRNDIFSFHPQNCPLTNKIECGQLSRKGNSLHSIVKGMVGQRERKVVGEPLAFEIPWVMGIKAIIWGKPMIAKAVTPASFINDTCNSSFSIEELDGLKNVYGKGPDTQAAKQCGH